MNNKTLSQSVSDFSKKLSRFNDAGKTEPAIKMTPDAVLQKKINDVEADRRDRFLRQYNCYSNPVSQQIEEDETNIISAYNLYKAALELNASSCNENTKLASLKISSSLCEKGEYVNGGGFSFLRIWFLKHEEGIEYVPVITQDGEKRYLEFVPVDEYEFTRLEKEILQIIPQ
nr:hypothetical protein [uncultured Treponema sp.]